MADHAKIAQLVDRIRAARSLDAIFVELREDLRDAFDAERMMFYGTDRRWREIATRYDEIEPLELDMIEVVTVATGPAGVARYVAKTAKRVNIVNARDKAELAQIDGSLSFDALWDGKTGSGTRQILAMPVIYGRMFGVLQFINKRRGDRFTSDDEQTAMEVAKALGIALSAIDQPGRRRGGKFDYLLIQDLLTQDALSAAIGEARRQQADVESILVNTYRVSRDDIGVALSMYYRCQYVEFSEELAIDPELLGTVKVDYLKFNCWVPLARRGKIVDVLVDNPHDLQRVDNIKRVFAGSEVRFFVGLRQDILRFIDRAARADVSPGSITSILGELADEVLDTEEEEASVGEVDLNDSAVVRLAHQLILDARRARASDVHIEPRGAKHDTLIRLRVDGHCIEYERVPPARRRALVARLKIMAGLDIAERRRPQDGKITFHVADQEVELRVATLPTAGGNEDVAMRFLTSNTPLPLDSLGMTEGNLRQIKQLVNKPYGLILSVGPTGAGKTTTLHALLGSINTPDRRILTAEDPVEITQEGLRQVQVQPKIGFTFAAAMRAFLRADPDVIMVGEMRDQETAAIVVEASLTGHLVLSTLHTGSAVETVIRLLDMGVDPFTFADVVLGVLAQRLVRCICPDCKEAYHPIVDAYEELADAYGRAEFEKLGVGYDREFRLTRGKGCAACNQTGYKGRVGIHELLVVSDEIKRLIQTRAPVTEILAQARVEGMTTLAQDGILKSLQGVTDLQQVRAAAFR